jgi:hypothetical protein
MPQGKQPTNKKTIEELQREKAILQDSLDTVNYLRADLAQARMDLRLAEYELNLTFRAIDKLGMDAKAVIDTKRSLMQQDKDNAAKAQETKPAITA